ncbi:hypothetical protein HanIR_Chr04g0151161 [Helianthus annuus]|nr:hypothetical protein HanIR_Chr04g0151161 [Helianthus annuus]
MKTLNPVNYLSADKHHPLDLLLLHLTSIPCSLQTTTLTPSFLLHSHPPSFYNRDLEER